MLSQVPETTRPQQRVGDRMTDHVAIRMTGQSGLAVESDAAEVERSVRRSGVQVDAEADADLTHPGLGPDGPRPSR